MRTSIRCFTLLTLGAILSGSSSFAATFQLVGSDPAPTPITGSTFNFTSNGNGGGVFEFQNATGGVLTSLSFIADVPNGGACPPPRFNTYNVVVSGIDNTGFSTAGTTIGCPDDHFVLRIFGVSVPNGPAGVFTVNLNDDPENFNQNQPGGWGGATFQGGDTSTVPEPAAYALTGAGLAGFAIVRRRRSA